MDERELVKEFVKKWARYTTTLSGIERVVLEELTPEPMARTQAQMILGTMLTGDQDCREVALRLALAEFQVMVKQP